MARIHHILLAAPAGCEEKARAFFGGLLGLEEIPKPSSLAARGGVWFRWGDCEVHLGVDSKFRPAEKGHPAFEVESLDDLRARLSRAGVDTWEDEPYPGRRRFYARDPFGNRLEFLSRPIE